MNARRRGRVTQAGAALLIAVAADAPAADASAAPPAAPTSAPRAGEGDGSERDLAKESENPIARSIKAPIKCYFEGGIGPYARTEFVAKLQPSIPVKITNVFALVTRWILPVRGKPAADRPEGTTWGIGDFNPQIYFAAVLPHDLRLGVGTTWIIPTATDARLGDGKLSVGPAAAAVWSPGILSTGFLTTQAWSIAGDASRADVAPFTLQPWVHLYLPEGVYLTSYPEMSADWRDRTWTVPVGGGVGRVMTIGVPVNVSVEAYWNAVRPPGGATWQLKLPITLVIPNQPSSK